MAPVSGAVVMIGSVAVEVDAAGPYLEALKGRFGVGEPTERDAECRFRLGPEVPELPRDDAGHASSFLTCWSQGDDHWVQVGDAVARVRGTEVAIGGPAETEDDMASLDVLCQSMIAVVFASPSRVVVHGAAVGRGSDALLVVGPSGAGKSTTAAAALLAGWELLSDDLVVVDLAPPRSTGIRRPPMFPDGLLAGSRFERVASVAGDDPRRRSRLPAEVLTGETRPLAGIVVVDHGTGDGDLDILEPGNLDVISGALAVHPYAPFMRRQFAALVQLVALPTYRMRHAADQRVRMDRAVARLDEALTDATDRLSAPQSSSVGRDQPGLDK